MIKNVSINLSEILLVLIVALVVIKPEQLPDVAFKLGRWSKQLRMGMNKLRRELDGTVSLPEKIEMDPDNRKT